MAIKTKVKKHLVEDLRAKFAQSKEKDAIYRWLDDKTQVIYLDTKDSEGFIESYLDILYTHAMRNNKEYETRLKQAGGDTSKAGAKYAPGNLLIIGPAGTGKSTIVAD